MSSGVTVPRPEQVTAFYQRHRTGLLTLVFTDLVESTALLGQLGDQAGATFLQQRRQVIRETLRGVPGGEEIETAGDSFLLVFARPSDAVRFALQAQAALRHFSEKSGVSVQERVGIHLGEVVIAENETEARAKDLYGIQLATCARVMSLAQGGQILLTRGVFDNARQVLKGEETPGLGPLAWVSHGSYLLKGVDGPIEVCEVGEIGPSPQAAPKTSDKAQRQVQADEEPVLGWRPAVGQLVPDTRWRLETKLGEGGFGEVWLARNTTTRQARVFKFCFQAARVRFLRRELTLFRLLKERVGDHPNIVAIYDINLDRPPFSVEMEYVEGKDLRHWCQEHGGVSAIPLPTRLEIVAQVADALQTAHEAGVIHRDVKPANILIGGKGVDPNGIRVKLTDFGIGQVVSEEILMGITRAGFTETLAGHSSSQTGTQLYMAPELLAGKPASPRSDLYSVGVVLYQLLTEDLTRPVTTDWGADIDDQLLRADLQHCFAGKPEERFAGAALLARNLRQLPERRAEVARQLMEQAARERAAYRRGIARAAALAAVIVALVGMLAVAALSQSRKARQAAARANAGEQRARQNLYAADMLLAAQALQANNRGRAVQLLERNWPKEGVESAAWEWRYLWNLCRSEARALTPGHSRRVVDVAFSPDGELLFTAGEERNVKVWEVATRSLRRTIVQPFPVRAMALSPDGGWLVTGASDGQLLRWNTRTWSKEALVVPEPQMVDLVFSPTGGKLAIRLNSSIKVRQWKDQVVLASAPSGPFFRNGQSMAFSSDGERLAYPAPGGRVGLLHLKADRSVHLLPGSMDQINSIALSSDGRFLAAADWSPRIALWDLATGVELKSLTNHAAWVSSVAFTPDNSLLISASADQSLKQWDTRTWQEEATRHGHLDEVHCLAVSPGGDWIATGSKDGALCLWRTPPPAKRATRLEFPSGSQLLSLDGRTLLVVGEDKTLTRWDTATLQPQGPKMPLPNSLSDGLLALGTQRLAVMRPGGEVEIWSLALDLLGRFKSPFEGSSRLKFSPDDARLALLSSTREVSVWSTLERRQVAAIGRVTATISSVQFSPDSTHLALALEDNSIQVWQLHPVALLRTLTGQREANSSAGMAFSPDGRFLAAGSHDSTLRLWNLADGSFVPLPRALMAYFAVAFSPDGRRIAAAGPDPAVRIVDAVTGEEVASLDRNTSYRDFAILVRFSADGNVLLVMTDKALSVWPATAPGELKAAVDAPAKSP